MSLLRRFVIRAAQELRHNPEARAKASQVLEEQVKPRAQQAWQEGRLSAEELAEYIVEDGGTYLKERMLETRDVYEALDNSPDDVDWSIFS